MARSRLNERLAIVGTIDPSSQAAGSASTTAVSMAQHRELVFVLMVGVEGTSATVDFKLQSSATSGGTYADISGKSITQFVKASNDNNQATINIRSSELPAGQPFVKGVCTVGTAASLTAALVLAENDRYEPATGLQKSSVAQNVA